MCRRVCVSLLAPNCETGLYKSTTMATQMINFNTNWIMKLWASHLLIVPVLYALASPGERKQLVCSTVKPDDLELNSAKLVAASVMHHGELRCFASGAELRQSYRHICQGPTPDRDKWTNCGTQKLIPTVSNNQGE